MNFTIMPQLDIITFESASFTACLAFLIGLILDAYPHDEFFVEELETCDLLGLQVQAYKYLLFLTPLDQFTDICTGIPVVDGDFLNLIPAVCAGLIGGADDWSFAEKEAGWESDRGALGNIEGYDHVHDTLFSVIILYNLIGLLPYQSTATSYVAVTFTLSFGIFISINIIGAVLNGVKLTGHAFPRDVPFLIGPFLSLIELISYIARGFSLGIRLFANILAGHALLKILASFAWILTKNYGLIPVIVLPWLVVFSVSGLELLIAYLQAYVFAILCTIYTQDVVAGH